MEENMEATFNPRFQGTHFVRKMERENVEGFGVLSIPVFRGLILLAMNVQGG